MLGNSDNTRTKTDDICKDESCFGGFGGRFSYEQCRRDESGRRIGISELITVVCAFIMVGAFGALCGIVMYHIVDTNKPLYYPTGDMIALDPDTASNDTEAAIKGGYSVISTADEREMFVNVTSDVSVLYRVPTGVMLRQIDEGTDAYTSGFRAGDIIVSIDGISVSDIDEMNEIIASREAVTVSTVTVFRDSTYVVLDVTF